MPLTRYPYGDDEHELILFPRHCTFVLNNLVHVQKKIPVYIGSICNELNDMRPKNSPILHPLKTMETSGEWAHGFHQQPLLLVNTEKCKDSHCMGYYNFCNPNNGKCIGDKPESKRIIQNWWKKANVKGACDKKKTNKCVNQFLACNPSTGDCVQPNYEYSYTVNKQVLDWVGPEDIIAKQRPRYYCNKARIKKCAEQGKLCRPLSKPLQCLEYSQHALYRANNVIDKHTLYKLKGYGKCSKKRIDNCVQDNLYCTGDTGDCDMIEEYSAASVSKLHDELKKQGLPIDKFV